MTLMEIYNALSEAAPYAYLMAGLFLLYKEVVILGKHHKQIVADRDKIIERLTTDNVELVKAERVAREMAWKATDIGQVLAKMKDKGTE